MKIGLLFVFVLLLSPFAYAGQYVDCKDTPEGAVVCTPTDQGTTILDWQATQMIQPTTRAAVIEKVTDAYLVDRLRYYAENLGKRAKENLDSLTTSERQQIPPSIRSKLGL